MSDGSEEASTNQETTLQTAWFRAEGLERLPDGRIHPSDDMYRADVQAVEPERRRSSYMRSGLEALCVLENGLGAAGRRLADLGSLLDFAGGYGRLLRFLVCELPAERIWFSDILDEAVRFAADSFGVHAFPSRARPADLSLPRRFDAIWVGSLFSHLPREDFGPFLAVLFEALAPEGLLLFSTHTPRVLPAEERDPSGFTFRAESESNVLDKEVYGSTFVEPAVVREICAELGIEHAWSLEQDLWRIQDVHAVARRRFAGLDEWRHTPLVRGSIEAIEVRGDLVRIGGWARVPSTGARLEGVRLVVDGSRSVPTTLLEELEDLPPEAGGASFRQTNWYVEGSVQELGAGFHTICAVGEAGESVRSCFDARSLHVD